MNYEDVLMRTYLFDTKHNSLNVSEIIKLIQDEIINLKKQIDTNLPITQFQTFDFKTLESWCESQGFPIKDRSDAADKNRITIKNFYHQQYDVFRQGVWDITEPAYSIFNCSQFFKLENFYGYTFNQMINLLMDYIITTIIKYSINNQEHKYKHYLLNSNSLKNYEHDLLHCFDKFLFIKTGIYVNNKNFIKMKDKVFQGDENCSIERRKHIEALYILKELNNYDFIKLKRMYKDIQLMSIEHVKKTNIKMIDVLKPKLNKHNDF